MAQVKFMHVVAQIFLKATVIATETKPMLRAIAAVHVHQMQTTTGFAMISMIVSVL